MALVKTDEKVEKIKKQSILDILLKDGKVNNFFSTENKDCGSPMSLNVFIDEKVYTDLCLYKSLQPLINSFIISDDNINRARMLFNLPEVRLSILLIIQRILMYIGAVVYMSSSGIDVKIYPPYLEDNNIFDNTGSKRKIQTISYESIELLINIALFLNHVGMFAFSYIIIQVICTICSDEKYSNYINSVIKKFPDIKKLIFETTLDFSIFEMSELISNAHRIESPVFLYEDKDLTIGEDIKASKNFINCFMTSMCSCVCVDLHAKNKTIDDFIKLESKTMLNQVEPTEDFIDSELDYFKGIPCNINSVSTLEKLNAFLKFNFYAKNGKEDIPIYVIPMTKNQNGYLSTDIIIKDKRNFLIFGTDETGDSVNLKQQIFPYGNRIKESDNIPFWIDSVICEKQPKEDLKYPTYKCYFFNSDNNVNYVFENGKIIKEEITFENFKKSFLNSIKFVFYTKKIPIDSKKDGTVVVEST